jgi:hypothetical protein
VLVVGYQHSMRAVIKGRSIHDRFPKIGTEHLTEVSSSLQWIARSARARDTEILPSRACD